MLEVGGACGPSLAGNEGRKVIEIRNGMIRGIPFKNPPLNKIRHSLRGGGFL